MVRYRQYWQQKKSGHALILPRANETELRIVGHSQTQLVNTLLSYVNHLCNGTPLAGINCTDSQPKAKPAADFLEVRGQVQARRAVQIAAAGRHNLLMIGPPGCGKTLLAQNLNRLLPPLTDDEAMEVAAIRSVSQQGFQSGTMQDRPLRCPHHTATHVALVGGGNRAYPGEITLAHRGVLFLDEFSQFKPSALDAMRESLESGEVTISRANYRLRYPADFQLVAAMNPCPCGYASDPKRDCRCAPEKVSRYIGKISGPLLDRIDLIVEMPSLTHGELLQSEGDEVSDYQGDWINARREVIRCHQQQYGRAGKLNSALAGEDLSRHCNLDAALVRRLAGAMDELGLSARAVHRIIRVARTIADFEGKELIGETQLLEAIAYRGSAKLRKLGMV